MEKIINDQEKVKSTEITVEEIEKNAPPSVEDISKQLATDKVQAEIKKANEEISTLKGENMEMIPGKLEAMQKAQTEEPAKKSFFQKLFGHKEKSLEDQKTAALAKWRETIMDLTHIKTVDTGLGNNLGNFNVAGVKFTKNPEINNKLEELNALNKKLNNTNNGPEAVALTNEKRALIKNISIMGQEEIENKFKTAA